MDSKERDTREKKGFSERGEKLYNPRTENNKTKKPLKYDSSGTQKKGNPKDINDELTANKKEKK